MDDVENFINQKFTNAHCTSQFHQPAAPSPTYHSSAWAYHTTNDGCVIAQPSNMPLSPVRQTVTYYAFQLFAEGASTEQADICHVFKEALKWEDSGSAISVIR